MDELITLEGPIVGGTRGFPYSSSCLELEPYGYEEVEYFISGIAGRFVPKPGTALGADGRWQVQQADDAPYRTRLLVRRPQPERFNGTVVVEFMQEYYGSERDTNFRWNAEALLREGFAWVGASLHHEGIDGPNGLEVWHGEMMLQTGPTLRAWDPERYGSLTVPHSDMSYAILSDVARAVGPGRALSVDPLPGLPVRHVVAAGNTIAAVRLQHYINAVHPLHRVFDGFYLQDLTDIGLPLAEGVESPAAPWVRTDVDAPVIVLKTTTAAMDSDPQPEGECLRFWEPAGSSHTTGPYMVRVAAMSKRDMDADSPICPPEYANTLPVQYVSSAAFVALHRWISEGEVASQFPLIDRTGPARASVAQFDEVGNVAAGLRTPWVDVPVARYDWRGDCFGGAGRTFPFSDEELRTLYGTPEVYRERFEASVHEAIGRGVLLAEDGQQAIEDSRELSW